MSELKPCPFCGGDYLAIGCYPNIDEPECFTVECAICGARGSEEHTEAEAIDAWNTRAVETCELEESFNRGGCYKCSECLAVFDGYEDDASYAIAPNYCPNCGRKVEQ